MEELNPYTSPISRSAAENSPKSTNQFNLLSLIASIGMTLFGLLASLIVAEAVWFYLFREGVERPGLRPDEWTIDIRGAGYYVDRAHDAFWCGGEAVAFFTIRQGIRRNSKRQTWCGIAALAVASAGVAWRLLP